MESDTGSKHHGAGLDHSDAPLRDLQQSQAEHAENSHLLSVDRVLGALASSSDGLQSDEARSRLNQYGPNQLRERKRTSAWMRLLLQFHNPLIYVLLATAGVTAGLHHWVDTGVIIGVVVINAIIGFIQESKAEQAIESLKQMLAPSAIALRDGKKATVPAADLVPGDVVLLQGGDKVPADLRLAQVKNLQIDEAPLTGESVPVAKTGELLSGNVPLADRRNMAFASTLAATGAGRGIVVATGDATQIGQIADMLREVQGVDTPLIRRLAYFSKVITLVIVIFCVFVFVVGILTGQSAMQMLMAAVAVAVSAIPEGLPAIMTIALAIGVKRMAARNAVVRKLPAVEALGSATVICTDKTGTLTRNEMTVTEVVTVDGGFTVQGSGYVPVGAVVDSAGDESSLDQTPALGELVQAGALCNDAALRQHDGQWRVEGDPTEGSLLVLAAKTGLHPDELTAAWPRADAIPFESEQQYMATLHHNHEGRGTIYLKGSPEKVLSLCRAQWRTDNPLDIERWKEVADRMAGRGLRVLAVAEKCVENRQTVLEYRDTKSDFCLLGLVGMMDPPREEAIQAVARCKAAGIRVKMITGDHVATAQTVGLQIGIGEDKRALSGTDVEQLSESQLDKAVTDVDIFARVSPAHKLRFVQSLQRQGEIVAMTGDGVNDAPALKQADIGVAMGITGTDVSKEAAAMVLLDDNFASIQQAVEEGRTVFNNLKKTILFILPTNGGECLTLMAALFLGVVLPILPLHILWINLITTVALAITLAFDPVDVDVMKRPPRDPKSPLIDRPLVWRIAYVSVLMAFGTFGLFYYELWTGSSLEVARAVAVNVIVFFEVAYLFNTRHLIECTLSRRGLFGNPVVWWGIAAVIAFQVIFTYWPVMNSLFHVAPMDAWMWLRVLAAAFGLLLFVEAEKAVARRFASASALSWQRRVDSNG